MVRLQDLVDKLQLKVKAYKRAAEEAVSVDWKSCISFVRCAQDVYTFLYCFKFINLNRK